MLRESYNAACKAEYRLSIQWSELTALTYEKQFNKRKKRKKEKGNVVFFRPLLIIIALPAKLTGASTIVVVIVVVFQILSNPYLLPQLMISPSYGWATIPAATQPP